MEVAKRNYGVDVSSYQDSNVANYSGAKFAIVKVSEGLDYRNPKAGSQVSTAKDSGMLPMAYHYGRFSSNSNVAVQEANYAVNSAKAVGLNAGSYLALDYEQGSGNETGGNAGDNTTAILAFLDTIVNAGYQPLLYSGAALFKSKIDTGKVLAKYPNCLWVASYPVSGAVSKPDFGYFPSMNGVAIWQFTDNWRGLNVDGNISLIDLKNDSKPVAQPSVAQSASEKTWTDVQGVTWHEEHGTFITGGAINLRWGANTQSTLITTLPAGSEVKYNAWARDSAGRVWLQQPRENGKNGYLVGRVGSEPWGTFK